MITYKTHQKDMCIGNEMYERQVAKCSKPLDLLSI